MSLRFFARLSCGFALAHLTILAGVAHAQTRLPPGTYTYSCDGCSFDGRILSCSCRTSGGNWIRSSMDWGGACSNQNVSNHEGRLVCADQ